MTIYAHNVRLSFQFFLIFRKQFDVVHVIEVFTFSCNLLSLHLAVHFPNMWFSGIIVVINSNSASPCNIPL